MARLLHLTIIPTFTPAYHAMLDTAVLIAERSGNEAAERWVLHQLEHSFDLFCELRLDRKPILRLVNGGAA
jgi:hypothetical protein